MWRRLPLSIFQRWAPPVYFTYTIHLACPRNGMLNSDFKMVTFGAWLQYFHLRVGVAPYVKRAIISLVTRLRFFFVWSRHYSCNWLALSILFLWLFILLTLLTYKKMIFYVPVVLIYSSNLSSLEIWKGVIMSIGPFGLEFWFPVQDDICYKW